MSPPATGTGTEKVVFSITLSRAPNNRLKPESSNYFKEFFMYREDAFPEHVMTEI
jgi:hypothetical protein